jgi:ribonucleotide reductase beta subunit family protein with ferritin-like domain
MSKSVFNKEKGLDQMKQPMFFGEDLQVQQYSDMKYPIFDKLNQQQLGYFWRPEGVSLQKDRNDYAELSDQQKFIFTSNLKYQTMLDSVQGRGPCLAFLPFVSNTRIRRLYCYMGFIETIHSRSYTHIIKNLYSNQVKCLILLLTDEKIEKRSESVTRTYDELIEMGYKWHLDTR